METSPEWLALMIGNSHLHWAYFEQDSLIENWQTNHDLITDFPKNIPLYLASVVPDQTKLFLDYPSINLIKLADIPLKNLYPTLGIDRALVVLGSGEIYGFPSLVIDGGTALTLTGINHNRELVGGAILPGLLLQFQSLSTKTAALPVLNLPEILPSRWAVNTEDAIASGILYSLLDGLVNFIQDWLKQFPNSNIILTGGDGEILLRYLQEIYPEIANVCKLDSHLIFLGMQTVKNQT